MHISISKLRHDHISPTDPDDISALTTELSGRPIQLSQEDVVDIAKRTTTIVARSLDDNNRIVGLGCVISMRLPQGYRHLIESIVVLPDYRNQGIGRKIIDALAQEAIAFGKGNINLTCNSQRVAAINLYQKAGFKKMDTTSVYRLCP